MNENATQRTRIDRTLSLGINVKDAKELPQAGRYLAKFLREIDHEHGPFDVTLAVSVDGGEMPMAVTLISAVPMAGHEEHEEEGA